MSLQADGILGLQKGLTPALCYQVVMNGIRFGLYRRVLDSGIISRADGSVSTLGCVAAGASVGIIGGFLGSPLYLVSDMLVGLTCVFKISEIKYRLDLHQTITRWEFTQCYHSSPSQQSSEPAVGKNTLTMEIG